MPTRTRIFTSANFALLSFILLLAMALRGPVTSFSPLIPEIAASLSLNGSQLGLITTIPLICFAFFALVASRLARHFDVYHLLFIGSGLILIGMVCRAINGYSTLIVGVTLIGAGIAIGNTLLPSVLKRSFPTHIPSLTALYVLMMSIGGFMIAAISVPLSQWYSNSDFSGAGWRFSLLCQTLIILLPIIAYGFIRRDRTSVSNTPENSAKKSDQGLSPNVWRAKYAWLITGFLAVNSFLNYVVVAWLPSMLIEGGFTQSEAGLSLGYMQLAGALPSLLLTPFINRKSMFPLLCIAAVSITTVSIFSLYCFPQLAEIWTASFGFSSTLAFILGLSLIGLKTHTTVESAELSGMAQLVGYTLAAIGPVLFGSLHDLVGVWQPILLILGAIALVWAVIGWKVSRPDF